MSTRMSTSLGVRRRSWLAGTLALAVTPWASMPANAIEEPGYTVVQSLGNDVEVRDYAAYVVAEVTVPGPAADAGGQAFPILAGYIFGKNQGEQKMAMTAPVTQAALPKVSDVTATPEAFVVQFVLPAGITRAGAPQPLDSRIRLRDVTPSRVAAIRYSGMWSQSNQSEHLAKLQSTLQAAGLAWTGEPVLSRYNGPMTPWFMRRNEVWLTLK